MVVSRLNVFKFLLVVLTSNSKYLFPNNNVTALCKKCSETMSLIKDSEDNLSTSIEVTGPINEGGRVVRASNPIRCKSLGLRA